MYVLSRPTENSIITNAKTIYIQLKCVKYERTQALTRNIKSIANSVGKI